MSRNVVNLDALIPREDISAPPTASYPDIPGLKIADLAPGLIYNWLRKPDFQRETANWSPEQISDLIDAFARGNIIPSIVLWQSGQRIFVVDGAHRLSALIAWVRDDYGAGPLSVSHYQNQIPDQQRALHEATRSLVELKTRSYEEHTMASQYPKSADPDVLDRATKFPVRSIDVQWIRNGTVDQARAAFFRINQGGTKIDPTEIRILRSRNSALALSARAITRGGAGHNYWECFESSVQDEIKNLGSDIQKLLFRPVLTLPIKTLDVPLAGFGYGSHVLPFAFDLVTTANNLAVSDAIKRQVPEEKPDEDLNGIQTTRHLAKVKRLLQLICSTDSSSVGLHPALYFYAPDGTFLPVTFFNIASWLMDLEEKKKLSIFLRIRAPLEKLILDHPVIVKPASHKLGSRFRSRPRTVRLFNKLLDLFSAGHEPEKVWETITSESEFQYLLPEDREHKLDAIKGQSGARFGRKAKNFGFLQQALPDATKCPLCRGMLHRNSMQSDHKEERWSGGSSAPANARMVHPICNSTRRGF